MIREFAPAKINLYLHITGRRTDGYHVLDSLTAFAGVGDEIRLEAAPRFDFIIDGPQADLLKNQDIESNLAVRAARALAERTGNLLDVRLTLIKNLPVASGVGGGASDAAAALRALAFHWDIAPDDPRLFEIAALCGQDDVPVCLRAESSYITAEGPKTGPELPYTNIVLVNPGKALSTATVYKAYKESPAAFSGTAQFKDIPRDTGELTAMLKARSNDLAAPALALMSEISAVLRALEASDHCLLARMSGSGATCFGIFPDRDSARKTAADILAAHPDWWVIQSHIPLRRDRRRGA
jgi:4-diphosphocytidyl-2-C-methyl-D-erythritol kinase